MSTQTVNSSPEKEGLLSKAEQAAVREKKETNFQQIMKRLLKNKLAVTGGIIFLILCLLAIFAPIVAPYDYFSAVGAKNLGPSLQHSLRHTFATRALEQGMDVVTLSRLLGHATPSVTLDKYGHALNDHKRASVEKLGGVYSAGRGIPRSRER